MNIYKKFFLSLNFIFLTIFVSNLGYSMCVSQPESISVKSGNYDLGDINLQYNPKEVFVKSSLSSHALTINFVFNNTELSCYSEDNEFVTFQLINGGDFIKGVKSVQTFENGNELTTFKFTYNLGYNIVNTLNSKYKINSVESRIVFKEDVTKPSLIISGIDTSILVKYKDNISFNYIATDSQSGPGKITISGGRTSMIYDYVAKELNGEIVGSEPTSYSDTPSSSKIYTVRIEDKLGNFETKTISVVVDSKAPDIVEIKKTYIYNSNARYVKFSVLLEDESFVLGMVPTIIGNFDNINSDEKKSKGVCNQNDVSENQYLCIFLDVEIKKISDTILVPLFFNVTDGIGNSEVIPKTEEIFIDSSEPMITEFNVYNSLGIKNKVSIFDKNITVKLIATDKSLIKPRIIVEDFDEIQFAPTKKCEYQSSISTLICTWELGNYIDAYSGFNDLETAIFKVIVVDNYGNSAEESVTIIFDSDAPTLAKDIEVREQNDIKNGVLKSGDVIDFILTIDDDNMITEDNKYFVYANLSSINYDEEYNWVEGRCNNVGDQTVCDFLNIELNSGYFLKNVTFYVSDIMGNKNKFDLEVEVFAVSNEVSQSFSIDKLDILNPISRERILEESVTVWFEGKINNKEENKGIEIINYLFLNCNESDLGNLDIINGRDELYPENTVFYLEEGDEEFILKMELQDHRSMVDLVKTEVSCSMSVLKRDNVSIFPEEIVEFDIVIDFFNSKRGSITQALAEDIVADIENADKLGEKFDQIYNVYETLSSVCNTVSSTTGLIAGVSSSWQAVSLVLHKTGYGSAPALLADNAIFGAEGLLSTLNTGVIGSMCDMLTCKNGGLISGFGGDTGLGEWLDDVNSYTSKACTFEFAGTEEDE
jgi:hypothetical protein